MYATTNVHYYQKANRMISELIKQGKKKFILFPFGERGQLVKSILNERYGIEEEWIVDNGIAKVSQNNKIIELTDLEKIDMSDMLVLLTSDNEKIYSELRYQLMQYVEFDKIIDLFSISMFYDSQVYYEGEYWRSTKSDYLHEPRICMLETAAREIYKNNVGGAIAEFGVYQGEFANYMSRCMPDRKFYLFDTFSGFDKRDIDEKEDGFSGEFRQVLDLTDTTAERAVNNIAWRANTVIRKGWFPETTVGLENEQFAFVSLDVDLYYPTLAGLEFFYPRMSPGGYIFVHDFGAHILLGVREAVIEFCKKENVGYVTFRDGASTTAVVVKPL